MLSVVNEEVQIANVTVQLMGMLQEVVVVQEAQEERRLAASFIPKK